MGMLSGKRALIVGVASKLSIAYGIAEAMHREGAELAFTYQNDKLKDRILGFAESWGTSSELCFPCDVGSDEEIDAVFDEVRDAIKKRVSTWLKAGNLLGCLLV